MIFIQQHLLITLIICLIFIAFIILLFGRSSNEDLKITKYSIEINALDSALDGLQIAHLSDLHGNDHVPVFEALSQRHIDFIVCTGDIYDGVKRYDQTTQFIQKLLNYAPVYFVSGNHEYYARNWNNTKQMLMNMGVHVLDNKVEIITINNAKLEICGIEDPDLDFNWNYSQRLKQFHKNLAQLPKQKYPRILLSHRADLFDEIPKNFADLVLSGHMHGGQWRFFNRGILAPHNGDRRDFFPRYTSGIYHRNQMKMIASCGLGDQMKVPRLFNPPELVLITLRAKNQLD